MVTGIEKLHILKKQADEVMKKIEHIERNECPNFFITGKSILVMEELGLQLMEKLEEQDILRFSGICNHFTIMMPYYDSYRDAMIFMNHLENSVSIAKDCYSKFEGIILVELDAGWSKRGKNRLLHMFWNYVKDNKNIRFILLLPAGENQMYVSEIVTEFISCGCCMKIDIHVPTVQESMQYLNELAETKGSILSDATVEFLTEKLKTDEVCILDHVSLAEKILEQILFEKRVEKTAGRNIEVEDIRKYWPEKQVTKHIIGFHRG